MIEKPGHGGPAVPGLPDLHITGPQQPHAFRAPGGRAMREQQAQARMPGAQGLEQQRGRAGFAQGHGMYPDQLGARFRRLAVAAEAFVHRFQIARLFLATACQLAAQQGLAQRHERRIQPAGPTAHAVLTISRQPSQACQTVSTLGVGWANTLICLPCIP